MVERLELDHRQLSEENAGLKHKLNEIMSHQALPRPNELSSAVPHRPAPRGSLCSTVWFTVRGSLCSLDPVRYGLSVF